MLISIEGPQGTGKSTVLKDLTKIYGYNIISQRTSRSILKEWGFTLNQINSVKFLTQKFQDEIIVRHSNIAEYYKQAGMYLHERSAASIFSYCLNILGPFNEFSIWLNNYYHKCKELQSKYDAIIYLGGRNYTPEDDGTRSINKHFTNMMDIVIKHYVQEFDIGNVLYVETPIHNERIEIIKNYIEVNKLKIL